MTQGQMNGPNTGVSIQDKRTPICDNGEEYGMCSRLERPHPLTLHADWSSMNAKPIVPDASAFSIPEYPIRHDVELEQRTLDALDAAYESAILAELDRDGREDAL